MAENMWFMLCLFNYKCLDNSQKITIFAYKI